jgi:tetratricopeptide (TPR) repeat protein
MNRLKKQWLAGCVMVLLTSGCVAHKSHRTLQPSATQNTLGPSSLSDYIRGVYKLSEEASRQMEQRTALLADAPELADLVERAEQNPPDIEARSRLVAEYMSRKLYWGAYELLTNALPANLNDPDINLNLAVIWDAWGLYDLAQQYVERAIANGAVSARAFETIGRIELHRHHPTEALIWYGRTLENDRTAPVLANIGFAHMLKSEWESARASLEEATHLDDTLEEAHNNLAIVLSKIGDDAGALAHLLRTGRPAVAFNNMGVLCLQEEKLGDARHYFEEALKLEPNYERARRNLEALETRLPPPGVIDLPAFGNDADAPGEVHLEAELQAPVETKAPNVSGDTEVSSRIAENPFPNASYGSNVDETHTTGVK